LEISIPWKIPALCRRCCCGPTEEDLLAKACSLEGKSPRSRSSTAPTADLAKLADTFRSTMRENPMTPRKVKRRASSMQSMVMAQESRPLDMLSFLSNDIWILDDVTESQRPTVQQGSIESLGALSEENEEFSGDTHDYDIWRAASAALTPGVDVIPGETPQQAFADYSICLDRLTAELSQYIETLEADGKMVCDESVDIRKD